MARSASGRSPALLLLAAGSALGPVPAGALPAKAVEDRPFEGLRALVVRPENFWGWDSAVFGALEERGFETEYGTADRLERPGEISRYDLVATNIRRSFTPAQGEALKSFVRAGGALYGSWGGPMGTPDLLEFCRVRRTASVRIAEMTLPAGTPLTAGLGEKRLPFPRHIGHVSAEHWEIVSMEPLEGGLPVARAPDGRSLGVLAQVGQGRTALLGFGPEKEKQFADGSLGPLLMDNLLRWLLEARLASPRPGPGRVSVALPARAEILRVSVGDREIKASFRTVGSLRKVEIDLSGLREGGSAAITLSYRTRSPMPPPPRPPWPSTWNPSAAPSSSRSCAAGTGRPGTRASRRTGPTSGS